MENLKDYALTAEAARILGVSQNTVRAWARDGRLPVRRNPANGYRLFLRSDLQKFLKDRRPGPLDDAQLASPLEPGRPDPKKEQAPVVPYGNKEGSRSTEVAAG